MRVISSMEHVNNFFYTVPDLEYSLFLSTGRNTLMKNTHRDVRSLVCLTTFTKLISRKSEGLQLYTHQR